MQTSHKLYINRHRDMPHSYRDCRGLFEKLSLRMRKVRKRETPGSSRLPDIQSLLSRESKKGLTSNSSRKVTASNPSPSLRECFSKYVFNFSDKEGSCW